jgi:hypothetical protein
VNYVGNKGYDDLINNPYLNSNDAGNYGGLPSTAPDLRVTNVTELQNTGTNNYNGITLSLQRTFSHGFLGRVNYTYSHELDDTSNGGILPYFGSGSILNQINPFSLRSLNYSDGDYDLRHSLTANYVYTMPFHSANRLMDLAIGGWVLSGTFYYHTGFPFSPTDNAEQNALNVTNANLANVTVLAAPLPGTPRNCTSPTTSCFTTADFATASDFGTVPRNSFRGPNYFNTDFSLRKNFRLTERFGLELGANAYNVLNHPNFSNPITNNTNPSFGSITSTVSPATTPYGAFVGSLADPRIIQLIAKLNF